jgi:hypothetical protein
MHARRRAPSGCGPQARWLCCALLTYHPGYARRARLANGPGGQQQSGPVILSQTLSQANIIVEGPKWAPSSAGFRRLRGRDAVRPRRGSARPPAGHYRDRVIAYVCGG